MKEKKKEEKIYDKFKMKSYRDRERKTKRERERERKEKDLSAATIAVFSIGKRERTSLRDASYLVTPRRMCVRARRLRVENAHGHAALPAILRARLSKSIHAACVCRPRLRRRVKSGESVAVFFQPSANRRNRRSTFSCSPNAWQPCRRGCKGCKRSGIFRVSPISRREHEETLFRVTNGGEKRSRTRRQQSRIVD